MICFPTARKCKKKSYFRKQCLQIVGFQQRYSKYLYETPYLGGELVPKTFKNQKKSPQKNFLRHLITKLENLFVFAKA